MNVNLQTLIAQMVGPRIVGWMVIHADLNTGEQEIMSQSYKVRIEDGSEGYIDAESEEHAASKFLLDRLGSWTTGYHTVEVCAVQDGKVEKFHMASRVTWVQEKDA